MAAHTLTYKTCKTVIESGRYEKEDMMIKLDRFLLGNRITPEEYDELVALMNEKEEEEIEEIPAEDTEEVPAEEPEVIE